MKKILAAVIGCGMIGLLVPCVGASAISEEKQASVAENCETIKARLVILQHSDSRTRVYLGRYYEIILSDFITPLNIWLVGHNVSNTGLIDNQSNFALKRGDFVSNYITYQKSLEGLVAMDCKNEPSKFYDELVRVREKREIVENDVKKMRSLMTEQVMLVKDLRGKL